MLVGAGALDATEEVMQVADTLGAGVAKALLGKAVVPDDVPYVTGSIGLLGTKPSWDLMQGADTLLMVGSGFPYSEFLPPIGQARGIQIDVSGRMLSIRYPMELALLGDSKQTLAELLPLLERKEDRSWQEKIVAAVEDWWKVMDSRAEPADVDRDGDRPRVRPQAVFAELSRQLPDRAVLSSDSGSAANWYARHIRMRTGMKGTLSGSLATMVPGMAYTIAAKFAYPDRVAVGTIGDGAMQMGGMAELITAAKYYRDWDDPRMVVVVLNNEDLNQVTWEQRAMAGDPKFDASQDLPYVPYAAFAELIGLRGIKVDRSAQLADAFEEAFAADRPVIVDVMTDPEEPPIPPHITFAQFEALTTSVLADPKEGVAGAVNAAREFAEGILPRR
ncbi:hypothetical protein GCG21_03130 [Pseudactinotalea sp. HY160]|nr:hypothetical protein [Pseudactinotalea sp. HY160]